MLLTFLSQSKIKVW